MKRILISLIMLLGCSSVFSDVNMPYIFSDNMVLQRDIPLNVWGFAAPGENVTVEFAGQKASAAADANGKWALKLQPLKLNKEAQDFIVTGKNKITLKNVLVGDVWVSSGQSNMEWYMFRTNNAKEEVAASANPLLRLIKIPNTVSLYPKDDVAECKWMVAGPESTDKFSAISYYFAKELVKETGIPIGMLNTCWSGTKIEPWMSPESLRANPELKSISEQADSWNPTTEAGKKAFQKYMENMQAWIPAAQNLIKEGKMTPPLPEPPGTGIDRTYPTAMFNAMVYPVVKYGIKGIIWYQGSANSKDGPVYTQKMRSLVAGWRELWQQGDVPFFYAQYANYMKPNPDPAGGDGWASLRENQLNAMAVIPNSAMIVTIDLGESENIHPSNKVDVGRRYAALALAREYGKKNFGRSPVYKAFKIEGDKIRISFDYADTGLMTGKKEGEAPVKETKEGKLKWFAVADANKKWHWADAVIDGSTVLVSSKDVKGPVAVRYAYMMNPESVNLYNKDGFPVSPFRTDNW